jgi:hypothetical protein
VAILTSGGFVLEDGRFIAIGEPCLIQPGSILRLHYDLSEPDTDIEVVVAEPIGVSMEPGSEGQGQGGQSQSGSTPAAPVAAVAAPVEAPHAAPEHHASAPADMGSVVESVSGDSADLGQVMGFAESFKDNPWAPLIVVILAVVAVLGGRQGWKFYSERSAQKHELELKKLEIQANSPSQNGQQPPVCAVKDAEHEAKMAQMAADIQGLDHRMKSVEKQGMSLSDFDPEVIEDLEKRLKKLEKPTSTRKSTAKE